MNIELKNLKHSSFASHETPCYQATVYVDGKKAFTTSNNGQGGPDNMVPEAAARKVASRLQSEYPDASQEDGFPNRQGWDTLRLESILHGLVFKKQDSKQAKALMRTKILFIPPNTVPGSYSYISYKALACDKEAVINHVKRKYPGCTIAQEDFEKFCDEVFGTVQSLMKELA